MRRTAIGIVLPVLFAFAAAGCGGDDEVSPVTTPVPSITSTRAVTATATLAPSSTAPPTATASQPPAATATQTSVPATATSTATQAAPATPTTAAQSANPVLNLPVDQSLSIATLGDFATGAVDVAYDELGIPHIYGEQQNGVLFVQGYLTAAERFWQMDIFRRFAEGRLSEVFGSTAAEQDIGMRTMFTTRDGRRLEEALWQRLMAEDPEGAQATLAFTAGINAWLADLKAGRNGAQLPPEYTFAVLSIPASELAEWRPQDTVAIGRLQALSLSDSSGEEVGFARILASLPQALTDDVYRSAPAAPATVLPVAQPLTAAANARARRSAASSPSLELLASIEESQRRLHDANPIGTRDRGVGSNNWIIAPSLSASGFAMMANDPHLALYNPAIWHMVQLDAAGETIEAGESQRVNGVIFPGLPGVILGHNDYGAWGATVSGFDVTDVYLETVTTPLDYPASPRTVLFKGEQVPVLRVEETVNVRGFPPRTAIIEVVPHHGPMLADPNPNDSVVGLAATGMSVRWTGHEVTLDSRFLLDLNRARNVGEFREALRNFATGGQNWVWADVNGDIAYFPYVLVPQRPAGSAPFLPMPGTGDHEWLTDEQGETVWLPAEKFPQALNPAEGFLSTANNDQIGNTLDNDPLNDETYFAFSYDLGFREQRIQQMLSNAAGLRPEGAKIGVADVSRYQFDHQSKEAERLVPFLIAAAENRPELLTAATSEALERLREWGAPKPGTAPGAVAYDMVPGIDAAALRTDVPPRAVAVSDEEKTDAVAASIYVGWTTRLARLTFADDFQGTGIGSPGGQDATKALLHILEDIDSDDPAFAVHTKAANGESALWDDKRTAAIETRDEILLRALADGVTFVQSRFPAAEPADWLWGRIHQARFESFLAQGGFTSFNLAPFAAFGGRFTVNPADYSLNSDNFIFSGGPSMRLVVVLDPSGVHAVNSLPGGNNGNPGGINDFNRINPAKHYGDHVPGWLNGETFDLHVTRESVAAATQRHLRFQP
jgi:penicillin G amidase